jgi:hypothetical protein
MTYTSQYPPVQNGTYVKATTTVVGGYDSFNATDPAKSLTGGGPTNNWCSDSATTNQRFHIDLGSTFIIRRIYYENGHSLGTQTDWGAKNFTFWGSNSASAFAELTYGTDTNWTQLTIVSSVLDQHTGSDIADPKYDVVTNAITYRYYAFKFTDNYGGTMMTVRRIELQTEDGYGAGGGSFLNNFV